MKAPWRNRPTLANMAQYILVPMKGVGLAWTCQNLNISAAPVKVEAQSGCGFPFCSLGTPLNDTDPAL